MRCRNATAAVNALALLRVVLPRSGSARPLLRAEASLYSQRSCGRGATSSVARYCGNMRHAKLAAEQTSFCVRAQNVATFDGAFRATNVTRVRHRDI